MASNSFGQIFKFTTFGESHGPEIGCVVDGVPPGVILNEKDIQNDLNKRRPGTSKFVTQRKEKDIVRISSGVFEGKTTGTPVALLIKNEDQKSKDYEDIKDIFRPSHADYTYQEKYGITIMSVTDEVRAIEISKDYAKYLDLSEGSPVLMIERSSVNIDGRIVEFSTAYCSSENFVYSVHLT